VVITAIILSVIGGSWSPPSGNIYTRILCVYGVGRYRYVFKSFHLQRTNIRKCHRTRGHKRTQEDTPRQKPHEYDSKQAYSYCDVVCRDFTPQVCSRIISRSDIAISNVELRLLWNIRTPRTHILRKRITHCHAYCTLHRDTSKAAL
jgi:hypothetical protein